MKILIESDVFDITKRIKEIDDGYFICYNLKQKKYELHNQNQEHSYCLTIPYRNLDDRIIDLINMTKVANIDNIIADIDRNNSIVEQNHADTVKSIADYCLREIYSFANNSSKDFDYSSAFSNIWR